jgi:hypothetical protein
VGVGLQPLYLVIIDIISPVLKLVMVATVPQTRIVLTILQAHFSADRSVKNSLRKSVSSFLSTVTV